MPPAGTDIAVDEQADFGYFVPPLNTAGNYLPESSMTVDELDTLGNLMIDAAADPEDPAPDFTMPPVLTYWGQFLDHELTARTDRESNITSVKEPHPPKPSALVESKLRNARSPRFDLDSVYGGSPIGPGITADVVTVISGLRHPTLVNKMRVGTALEPGRSRMGSMNIAICPDTSRCRRRFAMQPLTSRGPRCRRMNSPNSPTRCRSAP